MSTASSTSQPGRRGFETRCGREHRRVALFTAGLAVVVSIAGCAASDGIYWPYPTEPQARRAPLPPPRPALPPPQAPPPVVIVPPQSDVLARLPRDNEGLGRGPLGRAGVLLDRGIVAVEGAQRRGESVDPSLVAHLRMTRQARDLISTGENERAADLLERAIAIDDGAGFGYLYLGFLHLGAGNASQADAFLDRAAALLPPDPALRSEINALRDRAEAAAFSATDRR